MGAFAIAYHKDALDGLSKVEPKKIRQQIANRIATLGANPRPPGCAKVIGVLDGAAEVYRVRQGDYRVLYSILDDLAEITILDIGHRKDVYR